MDDQIKAIIFLYQVLILLVWLTPSLGNLEVQTQFTLFISK
jgi:hypothetical protein